MNSLPAGFGGIAVMVDREIICIMVAMAPKVIQLVYRQANVGVSVMSQAVLGSAPSRLPASVRRLADRSTRREELLTHVTGHSRTTECNIHFIDPKRSS